MVSKNNTNKPTRNLAKEGRIKKRNLSSILHKNGKIRSSELVIHGKELSKKKQKKLERQIKFENETITVKSIYKSEDKSKDKNVNIDMEMDIISFGSGTTLGAPQ
ncbi:5702_t:CDS:2 [Diversispora eburnea]|uniref:5702_t:CDS:1 n=1 Tax=Diversispora eburnea TaxID=1213867 RepID=A0A9N8YLN5_9GLOM|nr:5702_t:CDS:2 [Diversispora eburnea]